MKIAIILLTSLFFISCNKYKGYKGFGLKHDIGVSRKPGTFIYTPPPKDSTIKP